MITVAINSQFQARSSAAAQSHPLGPGSDFVIQGQYALSRATRKTTHVVAAVIRPCGWKHTRMGHYKAPPEDGTEVTTWGNREFAFEDIVNGDLGLRLARFAGHR